MYTNAKRRERILNIWVTIRPIFIGYVMLCHKYASTENAQNCSKSNALHFAFQTGKSIYAQQSLEISLAFLRKFENYGKISLWLCIILSCAVRGDRRIPTHGNFPSYDGSKCHQIQRYISKRNKCGIHRIELRTDTCSLLSYLRDCYSM